MFSQACVQFHFPFCGHAAHNDLKLYVPRIVNLQKALYKTFMYVLLDHLVYKDSYLLFSNLYYSPFVPATLFLTFSTYYILSFKTTLL